MAIFETGNICPHCNEPIDCAVAGPAKRGPHDGDFSICGRCFQNSMFDSAAPGGLRKLTPEEAAEIPDLDPFSELLVIALRLMAEDD